MWSNAVDYLTTCKSTITLALTCLIVSIFLSTLLAPVPSCGRVNTCYNKTATRINYRMPLYCNYPIRIEYLNSHYFTTSKSILSFAVNNVLKQMELSCGKGSG